MCLSIFLNSHAYIPNIKNVFNDGVTLTKGLIRIKYHIEFYTIIISNKLNNR